MKKLYVGNLPWNVDDGELEALFSAMGTVHSARVISDRETGRSKGFGFAEVDTAEKIQEAISAMDGQDLKGRRLRVSQAKERQPRRDREFKPRRFGGGSF